MDAYIPADALKGGLKQPTMLITRDVATFRLEREQSGGWPEKEITLTLENMRQVYAELPGDGYFLTIPGMFYVNFLDVPAWSPVTSLVGITGPIDGQRGFDILNAYSLAFFDHELKGQSDRSWMGRWRSIPRCGSRNAKQQSAGVDKVLR